MHFNNNGLYNISDEYFEEFPDEDLLHNHSPDEYGRRDRPYLFAFRDTNNESIVWMIPATTNYEKYSKIEKKYREKYGRPSHKYFFYTNEDGLSSVYLIQNICPVTENYVSERNDILGFQQTINSECAEVIRDYAKEVLSDYEMGFDQYKIFPNVLEIYKSLEEKLETDIQCIDSVYKML